MKTARIITGIFGVLLIAWSMWRANRAVNEAKQERDNALVERMAIDFGDPMATNIVVKSNRFYGTSGLITNIITIAQLNVSNHYVLCKAWHDWPEDSNEAKHAKNIIEKSNSWRVVIGPERTVPQLVELQVYVCKFCGVLTSTTANSKP